MFCNRYLAWKLLLITAILFVVTPIRAANQELSILCKQQETCRQLGAQNIPIFTEKNIVPGQSFSRILRVMNGNKLHSCQLHLRLTETETQENMMAEELLVQVFREKQLLLGSPTHGSTALTIKQLQTENFARYFWTTPPKSESVFDLVITLDPKAGNQYQGSTAQTDIAVAITCLQDDEFTTIGETAVVLPNPYLQAEEIVLASCDRRISQDQPQLALTRSNKERGSVAFSWQPVAGASEYWLEFGSEENSEQFRHKGITATQYAVLDLDLQHDLYFRLLPVADCARGSYSNPLQIFGKNGVKPGKSQQNDSQVLGAQERVVEKIISEEENQQSDQNFSDRYLSEWQLALFLVILLFFIILA